MSKDFVPQPPISMEKKDNRKLLKNPRCFTVDFDLIDSGYPKQYSKLLQERGAKKRERNWADRIIYVYCFFSRGF